MFKKIILSLSLVLSILISFAQKAKITGKVLSSKTGEPLIGATIAIDGRKKQFSLIKMEIIQYQD